MAVVQSGFGQVETMPPIAVRIAPMPARVVLPLVKFKLPFDAGDALPVRGELAAQLEELAVHLVQLVHHAHRRADDGRNDGEGGGDVGKIHRFTKR